MVTPVEIINGTLNVSVEQIKDSGFAVIASISSLIIAVITAISLYITGKQTQKSNKLLELDLKNRLRPTIQITDIRPYNVILPNNYGVISWDNYIHLNPKPIPITISFNGHIKNLGVVAIPKISAKWMQKNSEIKKDELEQGIEDPSFPLAVGESYPLTVFFDWQDYLNSTNNPLYLGTKVRYDVFDGIEEMGKIWKISGAIITSADYWIKMIDK